MSTRRTTDRGALAPNRARACTGHFSRARTLRGVAGSHCDARKRRVGSKKERPRRTLADHGIRRHPEATRGTTMTTPQTDPTKGIKADDARPGKAAAPGAKPATRKTHGLDPAQRRPSSMRRDPGVRSAAPRQPASPAAGSRWITTMPIAPAGPAATGPRRPGGVQQAHRPGRGPGRELGGTLPGPQDPLRSQRTGCSPYFRGYTIPDLLSIIDSTPHQAG